MSLSSLSSAELRRLIQLVKDKEAIQAKLTRVERALDALQSGTEPKAPASKNIGPRRGRRRAGLKDGILKELRVAGKAGRTVKELAASLRAKPKGVSVWFYTTGKKVKGVKKIGTARFAYIP